MSKKKMFFLEYEVKTSPTVLYNFIATSAGLAEWFADKVNIKGNVISVEWGNVVKTGKIVEQELDIVFKFRWNDADEDEYVEFRISKTEISNRTILSITDFALAKSVDDEKRLWDHQVKDLFYRMGLH